MGSAVAFHGREPVRCEAVVSPRPHPSLGEACIGHVPVSVICQGGLFRHVAARGSEQRRAGAPGMPIPGASIPRASIHGVLNIVQSTQAKWRSGSPHESADPEW